MKDNVYKGADATLDRRKKIPHGNSGNWLRTEKHKEKRRRTLNQVRNPPSSRAMCEAFRQSVR